MQRRTPGGREGGVGGAISSRLFGAFNQVGLGLGLLLDALQTQAQDAERKQQEAERKQQEAERKQQEALQRQEQEADRKLQEAVALQERKAALALREAVGQMETKLLEKERAILALQQRLGEMEAGEGRAQGARKVLEEVQGEAAEGGMEGSERIAESGDLLGLESRMQALETSLERTLQDFFPRVDGLLRQMEDKGQLLTKVGAPSFQPSSFSCDGKSSNKEVRASQQITSPHKSSIPSLAASKPCTSTSFGASAAEGPANGRREQTDADHRAALQREQRQREYIEARIQQVKKRTNAAHAKLNRRGEDLHTAITNGKIADVQYFIKAGADINYINRDGRPPLQSAVMSIPRQDVVELLVDLGADVNAVNFCGTSALHHVAGNDRSGRCVDLLLGAGANVNARSGAGATPLHWAAHYDNEAAVRALLAAGANRDLVAWSGAWKDKTPFDLAKSLKLRVLLA